MIRSMALKILNTKRDGLRCSRLFLGLALVVLSGIFTPAEAQYANGYSYRVEVDFVDANVSGGPHANFPVLISSTVDDLKTVGNGGKVTDANGYDIIFTSDKAGTTQLAHEIESYVPSTGEIVFWVRVESLAATTKIYMFFGNSGISTFQGDVNSNGVTGVWDDDYKGVWHLKEAGGTHDDSAGSNDGTRNGSVFAAGKIAGGQLFDGDNDYVALPDGLHDFSGTFSVSLWAQFNVLGNKENLVAKAQDGNNFAFVVHKGTDNKITMNIKVAGSQSSSWSNPNLMSAGQWHHITANIDDSSEAWICVDDFCNAHRPMGDRNDLGSLRIGETPDPYWGSINGTVDEVRISGTVRTADWTFTEFNNQDSPSTFYTLGPLGALVKRAFLADGTPLSDGDTVRKGAVVKYLIYLNNPGGVLPDVSVQDALDPTFAYQASTLKVNNSTSDCVLEDCTPAEEATIFSDVDVLAAKTDAVDGDVVSITGSTIDAGDQNVANGVASAAASKVWALLFEVKMQ